MKYIKNLPKNISCKSLYELSEKIRCEVLGSIMLKGIKKNFVENYNNKIFFKRKDQLKTKEDANISEAFELYMLKNFFNIKLNSLCEKVLSFWSKEFEEYLSNDLNFLKRMSKIRKNTIQNFQKYFKKWIFLKILMKAKTKMNKKK